MVYILNTEISDKKKVYIALQSIFGLGLITSLNVCLFFGISKKATIKNLNTTLKNKIIVYVDKNIKINEDLKQFLVQNKEQQYRLKTYRGQRARFKLPRRGQRTHTNAKTAKKFYK
jgi:small subunit ribosomal protein S13